MPYRGQSSLGQVSPIGRKDLNMEGYITIGRVLKVHHKYHTADVMLVNTKDTIRGLEGNQGKFACRINTGNAHYDKGTGKYWGLVEPICENDLVLVAFLDNKKAQPIIIQSFHRMEDKQNILPSAYPVLDPSESLKFLRVFPSQNYIRVDGSGDTEITFVGKSFLKIGANVTDAHGGTDFKDLSEKDKVTGLTLVHDNTASSTDLSSKTALPTPEVKKYLFVHRSSMTDGSSKYTKLFIDNDGTFRVSRDNNDNTFSKIEVASDGSLTLKRQLASGNIAITVNGDASLDITRGGSKFTLEISPTGALNISASQVSLLADSIDIVSPNVAITAKNNPESYVIVSDGGTSIGG